MLAVYFGVIAALCFGEGVLIGILVTRRSNLVAWAIAAALLGATLRLSRFAIKRADAYENERLSYRAGFIGEQQVSAELEHLPDAFVVFNNVNTKRGNLDHVVIGPTGLFAIETKNWTGLIRATPDGELLKNDRPATDPHIRNFVSRSMAVRDQIIALTGRDDIRIRAVMVFPKAHVEAPYGSTGKAHCVRLNNLLSYLQEEKFSAELSDERVAELTRAMRGVACMDVDFVDTGNGR